MFLLGSTGTGKTDLVRVLLELMDKPVVPSGGEPGGMKMIEGWEKTTAPLGIPSGYKWIEDRFSRVTEIAINPTLLRVLSAINGSVLVAILIPPSE